MSKTIISQARAYLRITAAQGASQQLIDFINFDGKMGEEIGLEGFETFSTQVQHEILERKLQAMVSEAEANGDEEDAEGEGVLTAEGEKIDLDDTEVKGTVITADPVDLPNADGAK